MLLLACFLMPLDAAFQLAAHDNVTWLYVWLDVTFMADLAVNFRTVRPAGLVGGNGCRAFGFAPRVPSTGYMAVTA